MTSPAVADLVRRAAAEFGLAVTRIRVFKDVVGGNSSWLLTTNDGVDIVLRRYHESAHDQDIAYEYAVLRWLAEQNWSVPVPYDEPRLIAGRWWGLNRLVPGEPVSNETPEQRERRGIHMARLDLAMRPLAKLGQRPGWRPQHTARSVHTELDFDEIVGQLEEVDPRLAGWLATSADVSQAELRRLGADELPLTPIHGDFTEWNVHYNPDGTLAGVIDFGLARLESRPYELAMARTWRAPEAAEGYRAELARNDWPLTELEESLIEAIYHAFRVDMALWAVHDGHRFGSWDLAHIERQLERTDAACP